MLVGSSVVRESCSRNIRGVIDGILCTTWPGMPLYVYLIHNINVSASATPSVNIMASVAPAAPSNMVLSANAAQATKHIGADVSTVMTYPYYKMKSNNNNNDSNRVSQTQFSATKIV